MHTNLFWKTADGRCINIEDLSDEHLINILNLIEYANPCGELRGASYHTLRMMAVKRGLNWQRYHNIKLRDGDLRRPPRDERPILDSLRTGQRFRICPTGAFTFRKVQYGSPLEPPYRGTCYVLCENTSTVSMCPTDTRVDLV